MTPQQFIAKWGPGGASFDLNERQGAQAHDWTDYTPDMPDDEILKRLLTLNLERAG